MIPTVLLLGIVVGFLYGVTRKAWIVNAGAIAAVVGWWLLLFIVGDSDTGPEIIVGSAIVALLNYAVAALIGWGGVIVLRIISGMTTE